MGCFLVRVQGKLGRGLVVVMMVILMLMLVMMVMAMVVMVMVMVVGTGAMPMHLCWSLNSPNNILANRQHLMEDGIKLRSSWGDQR